MPHVHVQQVFSPGQRIQLRIGATLNTHRTSSECSSPLSVAMRPSPAPTPPLPTTSYSPLVVAAVGRLDQQFGVVTTCEQAPMFATSSSAAAALSGIISSSLSSTSTSTCASASASAFSGSGRPAGAGSGACASAELCSGFPPGAILQWPPKSPVQSPIQSPSRAHQSTAAAASSQHQLFRRSLLASKRKSELHVFQYR